MKRHKSSPPNTFLHFLFLAFIALNCLSPYCLAAPLETKKDYQICIGDKIFISVWKNPDLSATVTVRPDGKISFFLVGDVVAAGLGPRVLKDQITKKLSTFISNPDVSVILTEFSGMDVYVLGEVIRPGIYQWKKDMSMMHLLVRAGGLKETAQTDGAFLLRNNEKIVVDLNKLLFEGDLSQNLIIQTNDLLYIPQKLEKNIAVFGEVRNPGSIPFTKGLTITNTIALSGGLNEYANASKIKILRGKDTLVINLEKLLEEGQIKENIDMMPDDVVVVPKSLF